MWHQNTQTVCLAVAEIRCFRGYNDSLLAKREVTCLCDLDPVLGLDYETRMSVSLDIFLRSLMMCLWNRRVFLFRHHLSSLETHLKNVIHFILTWRVGSSSRHTFCVTKRKGGHHVVFGRENSQTTTQEDNVREASWRRMLLIIVLLHHFSCHPSLLFSASRFRTAVACVWTYCELVCNRPCLSPTNSVQFLQKLNNQIHIWLQSLKLRHSLQEHFVYLTLSRVMQRRHHLKFLANLF